MSQQRQQDAERNVELPEECWELIFHQLGDHFRFEVISLVCKQFLAASSRLKHTLTINDPSIRVQCNLSKIFQRFHKISHIRLMCAMSEQEFNDTVLDISRSGLDLERLFVCNWTKIDVDVLRELGSNMKNLTNLVVGFSVLKSMDLVAIASSMPQLQKLSINPSFFFWTGSIKPSDGDSESNLNDGSLTDEGIDLFASKVRQLRRIHMLESPFVTDELLIALSSNCKFLTELVVGGCNGGTQLTENGIGFALRHCPNLMSIFIVGIRPNKSVSSVPSTLFSFENSISHARALCELDIYNMLVSDALLCSIAKARLPLKNLGISYCEDFTYSGLSFLLRECQSINHLNLRDIKFLTDQMMNDLSMFLGNVTHLQILSCPLLTHATFIVLTQKCPSLVDLRFQFSHLQQGVYYGLTENHYIKALDLSFIRSLDDKSLKSFGLLCPNIQKLSLNMCENITDEGIGEILKSCSQLTHLEVNICEVRRIVGTGFELSELKLEVLQASWTKIDDEGMAMIGVRCPGLLQLELNSSLKVTKKGVKVVLEKCINLREINLAGCPEVNFDMVPWMISTRPSLRKIIPPGGHVSKEEQRNLFLRHGCVVCNN